MTASVPADYAAVTEYLFSLRPVGKKHGIDRMRLLVDALGHPELGLPVVHVAGTNGKGSVAAMLEAVFREAGWRSGLYTSPHLVHLGERVQVSRQRLTEAEIVSYTHELLPVAGKIAAVFGADDQPSFFEYLTGMAFLQFARRQCDIGVIEVGLGGRLDATNIVVPEVSVITSIGLDHCELLGGEIAQIAAEKAGIIKAGYPVVIGRMPIVAEQVVRAVAAERNAPVTSVAEEFGENLDEYPLTNLEGNYQRWNAATATLTARLLGAQWRMSEENIARGLSRVEWAGRWQRVCIGGRLAILDASHNPEGAQVLEENLTQLVHETGRAPVVITGALGAERARSLQSRACSHAELVSLVPSFFLGRVVCDTLEKLFPSATTCSVGGPDDVLVVTGSIYLLGEVMARLEKT